MNDALEEVAPTPLYELPPTPTPEATQEELEAQLTRERIVTTPATDQSAVEEASLLVEPPLVAPAPVSPVPCADPEKEDLFIAAKAAASLPSESMQNQHNLSDLHSLKPTDLLGICHYIFVAADNRRQSEK